MMDINRFIMFYQKLEPHGSQAPRITYFTSSVQRQFNEQVEFGCAAAQSFPLPQFRYVSYTIIYL